MADLLAVAATFTADPLESTLAFWARELGWNLEVRFAPYNQVFQQLLDTDGLLARNRGVNAVLVRVEDWARFHNDPSQAVLESNVNQFTAAVRSAAGAFNAPLLVCLCPPSAAAGDFSRRAHAEIAACIRDLAGVYVVTSEDVDALYPVSDIHDPHADELGHVPYTPRYFTALATTLARRVHALHGPGYKVITLDCDETLWKGVCGEDGPERVAIDPPRRALQEFMLSQAEHGMLLALASKNNEQDVLETFRTHPEMPLQLEHFAARRINWDAKPANLISLAEDLDLALDSFVFVDDNPKECTEVQAACPEVLALALPHRPQEIPGFLHHVWAFDRLRITAEDRKRTEFYAQQAERARLEREAHSFEEFLRGLELDVRIAPPSPEEPARVAQLTNRTNQMNCTTLRRSEAEIAALIAAGAQCLAVHVSDRFGSYGLTGVVIFRLEANALAVDTFLLSCRVLGRGVEHRMLARLGEIALARGLDSVSVPFVPTARNAPARLFLASLGQADANGVFRFAAAHAAAVRYEPAAAPPRPRRAPARAGGNGGKRVDYARIARHLRTVAQIEEQVRGGPRVLNNHSAAPRTELEQQLAEIWIELLNLQSIGVHDNFFDLGGHSLLAVQLLSRVRQAVGVDLSLEVVYSGEFTIAELAKAVELKRMEQAGAGEYAALLAEIENLSDDEVRALLEKEEGGR